jgi:hypothetical protein
VSRVGSGAALTAVGRMDALRIVSRVCGSIYKRTSSAGACCCGVFTAGYGCGHACEARESWQAQACMLLFICSDPGHSPRTVLASAC